MHLVFLAFSFEALSLEGFFAPSSCSSLTLKEWMCCLPCDTFFRTFPSTLRHKKLTELFRVSNSLWLPLQPFFFFWHVDSNAITFFLLFCSFPGAFFCFTGFANRYHEQNPPEHSASALHTLSMAILLLNTDLHSPVRRFIFELFCFLHTWPGTLSQTHTHAHTYTHTS